MIVGGGNYSWYTRVWISNSARFYQIGYLVLVVLSLVNGALTERRE